MTTVEELEQSKKLMVSYLQLKLSEEDWHGVADAAMDLRDIEAKLLMLKEKIEVLANPQQIVEIFGLTPNQVSDLICYYEKNTGLRATDISF